MIKRSVLLPGPFHPINAIYLKNNGLLCSPRSVRLALPHAVLYKISCLDVLPFRDILFYGGSHEKSPQRFRVLAEN